MKNKSAYVLTFREKNDCYSNVDQRGCRYPPKPPSRSTPAYPIVGGYVGV